MNYYHVRITRRSDRGSDCLELDLSEKDLLQNMVEPYKSGKKFLCGGILVDPFDIEAIQINKTSQPSSAYLPAIRARNAALASSVLVVGIPDEWYVTEEGEVVTREFVSTAPGTVSISPEASTNKMTEDDQRSMQMAIQESRKSKDENDGRVHPKVGAVVVKDGDVLATAHRGEISLADHAEYTALERKLPSTNLNGAAIYTTLEPCTSRGHKTPCADRIIQRKIRKVVIGVLDPNPSIKGGSVYTLKQAGIEVDFAGANSEREIKSLNKAFLEEQCTTAKLGFDVKLQLDSDKARVRSWTGGIPTGWEVSYTFFNEGIELGRVFDSVLSIVLKPSQADIVCETNTFGPKRDFLVLPKQPVIGSACVSIKRKVPGLHWESGVRQLIKNNQVTFEVHIDYSIGDQAKRFSKERHLVLEAEIPKQ